VNRSPSLGYGSRVKATKTTKERSALHDRPAPPRVREVSNGDLRFEVRDQGPLDGPVAVLLHGFPERASHWDQVARRLHAAGIRTLAPDQRGYSPLARPRTRASYRMRHLVEDVTTLVGEIGVPVHLVGHDWGAAVAWSTAAEHPGLVRSLTTLCVPHPAAFARSLLTSSQLLRSWYALAFQPPGVVEAAVRLAPGIMTVPLRASGLDEEGVRRFEDDILASGALSGGLGWYRAAPLDAFTRTPPVRVPTTHVWCDQEVALSEQGARITGSYVEAPYELVTLEGVNHWAPTQAPDAVAAAVLARISAA
jgi:pimeloyl-ACP methyl ester carboxylesterase